MIQDMCRLDGCTVIVAGAGGAGMGTAVTRIVAEAGATVVAVDNDPGRIERDIRPLIDTGLAIIPVVADVLSEEGIAAIMSAAASADGRLHGLVTVIGGGPPRTWGPTTSLPRDAWKSQFTLNVDSMFYITQAVAGALKAAGRPGSIVSISSICGLTASPFNVGYGAAKRALQSVVETFALELARDDIRVNAIAPGAIETPTAHLTSDPQRIRRGIPMNRFGRAEEIAAPVLFLLSDMAAYMTGQCLVIDGGCNLKWTHLTDDNLPMFLKDESVAQVLAGSAQAN